MTATLNLYWTPPQKEDKAARECRQAGYRAYVPKERNDRKRLVPTARSYVAAEGKPCEAKDVGRCIGPVSRAELRRLYVRTSVTQRRHAFATGDKVISGSGYPGIVRRVHGSGRYDVEVVIANKPCVVKMKESDISHHTHPHT